MKLTIIKQAAFFSAALSMAFFSPALANLPSTQASKTLEQELRPILQGKKLRKLGDFRKVLAESLSEDQRKQLDENYGHLDQKAMPRLQLIGNKLFVHGPSELVTVELLGTEKVFLKVNGTAFTKKEVSSAEEFNKKWTQLNSKQDKKQVSFIMNLLFPQAHAFLAGHNMGSIALGGLVGFLGFWAISKMFPKKKEKDVKGYETGYNDGYNAGVETTADYYNGAGTGSTGSTGSSLGSGGAIN